MAAVITASMAAKEDLPLNLISGSTIKKLVKLHIKGTKAAQNDWFLLTTYLTSSEVANLESIYATVLNSTATSLDTFTYDSSDAKVVLSGATTGTSYVVVTYHTE